MTDSLSSWLICFTAFVWVSSIWCVIGLSFFERADTKDRHLASWLGQYPLGGMVLLCALWPFVLLWWKFSVNKSPFQGTKK